MSQEKTPRPRLRRPSVQLEEERAWIGFYRRVGNPAIATEVVHQLESDPEMKRLHLALYLRCKESLRMHKAQQARNQRIGQCMRMLLHALLVVPFIAVRRWLRQSGDLAIECLPEVHKEPAIRQVKNLMRDTEFAQAQSEFDSQAGTSGSRHINAENAIKASSPVTATGNAG